MKYKVLTVLAIVLLSSFTYANNRQISHVIYITLDGVRWQDIYETQNYFPKLWHKHAGKLNFYGYPHSNTSMEVTTPPYSLPSYQSQMAGAIQPCSNNKCGQIEVKTLPEYLVNDLHFAKKDVALFSSWPKAAYAVEAIPGTTYSNVGNTPVIDPVTNQADRVMAMINHEQKRYFPGYKANRYDKYTFAQALHYFEKHQPRFLWISLVNADDEANFGHLDKYHQLLTYYDDALDGLFNTLKAMHLDKNTLVIVTASHGRGNGENWSLFGESYPESRQTWAFVMNGELQSVGHDGDVYHYNTLSIRPTIEKVLAAI